MSVNISCLALDTSSAANRGDRTISGKSVRQVLASLARLAHVTQVDSSDASAVIEPPTKSMALAICSAFLVLVPLGNTLAVSSAMPIRASGSSARPALIARRIDRVGSRLSLIATISRPLGSFHRSTGGSLIGAGVAGGGAAMRSVRADHGSLAAGRGGSSVGGASTLAVPSPGRRGMTSRTGAGPHAATRSETASRRRIMACSAAAPPRRWRARA